MTVFILPRFLLTLLMLFLVGLTVFMLGHLTGDPVRLMVPDQATDADIERLRHALGLDQPLPIQFIDFIGNAARGDLGTSLRYRQPALQLVMERMPATAELSAAAMIIALVVAVPAGIVSATRRGSWVDALTSVLSVVGQSLP